MNRILADVVAFGKQYIRSKVGAFFTFVFPILLILLFGSIFGQTGSSSVPLPVQDLDNTAMSERFLSALNNTTFVTISMIPPRVDIAEHIGANSLAVALLIPSGFERDVIDALTTGSSAVNVTLYGDSSRSTFGVVVGVLQAVSDQMSFALAGARPVVGIEIAPVGSPAFRYIDYFLPGIVGMTVMINAMFWMTATCAEYRSRRYFKLLATTTLRKSEWLTSKILWFTLILTASLFVSVAVGIAAFNVQLRIDVLALAFILAGTFLFTSLGMLLGTFVKDAEAASALANAVGFPMMFISGSFFPLESMPAFLQTAARALPLTYLNNGLRDAMVFGNLDSALTNLAVVAVAGAVVFAIASRAMSWKGR